MLEEKQQKKRNCEPIYVTRMYIFSNMRMDIITFRLLFQVFVEIIFLSLRKTKNGKVQMAIGLKTHPIIFINRSPFIRLKYDCGYSFVCGCKVSNSVCMCEN